MNRDTMINHIALIGCGLIGSSLARVLKYETLCNHLTVIEKDQDLVSRVNALKLADTVTANLSSVAEADLIIICTPLSAYEPIAKTIAPHVKEGAIISDVGSVKQAAIEKLQPHLPDHIHLIPGHPIAGTENSGPESGFANLFHNRWLLLTPLKSDDPAYKNSVQKLIDLWTACGSMVETMPAKHHDQVLAITSHLPHLIAYTIVGTATDLSDHLKDEVIKYSASGFRDFTRIAASDPTMWRDVFLNNQEAVLDILQRFTEDLTELQKAIRRGEGQTMFDHFTRIRAIRRGVIDYGQDVPEKYKQASDNPDDTRDNLSDFKSE